MRGRRRSSPDQRLAAQAVVLALDPDYGEAAAVEALTDAAGGNRQVLRRALARIRAGESLRPSRAARQAAVILRQVLDDLEVRGDRRRQEAPVPPGAAGNAP